MIHPGIQGDQSPYHPLRTHNKQCNLPFSPRMSTDTTLKNNFSVTNRKKSSLLPFQDKQFFQEKIPSFANRLVQDSSYYYNFSTGNKLKRELPSAQFDDGITQNYSKIKSNYFNQQKRNSLHLSNMDHIPPVFQFNFPLSCRESQQLFKDILPQFSDDKFGDLSSRKNNISPMPKTISPIGLNSFPSSPKQIMKNCTLSQNQIENKNVSEKIQHLLWNCGSAKPNKKYLPTQEQDYARSLTKSIEDKQQQQQQQVEHNNNRNIKQNQSSFNQSRRESLIVEPSPQKKEDTKIQKIIMFKNEEINQKKTGSLKGTFIPSNLKLKIQFYQKLLKPQSTQFCEVQEKSKKATLVKSSIESKEKQQQQYQQFLPQQQYQQFLPQQQQQQQQQLPQQQQQFQLYELIDGSKKQKYQKTTIDSELKDKQYLPQARQNYSITTLTSKIDDSKPTENQQVLILDSLSQLLKAQQQKKMLFKKPLVNESKIIKKIKITQEQKSGAKEREESKEKVRTKYQQEEFIPYESQYENKRSPNHHNTSNSIEEYSNFKVKLPKISIRVQRSESIIELENVSQLQKHDDLNLMNNLQAWEQDKISESSFGKETPYSTKDIL